MKINRSTRLKIYKDAKNLYSEFYENGKIGICYVLKRSASDIIGINLNYHDLLIYFPEFKKIKPNGKNEDHYWWPLINKEIRFKSFDEMIDSLENKTNNNIFYNYITEIKILYYKIKYKYKKIW